MLSFCTKKKISSINPVPFWKTFRLSLQNFSCLFVCSPLPATFCSFILYKLASFSLRLSQKWKFARQLYVNFASNFFFFFSLLNDIIYLEEAFLIQKIHFSYLFLVFCFLLSLFTLLLRRNNIYSVISLWEYPEQL